MKKYFNMDGGYMNSKLIREAYGEVDFLRTKLSGDMILLEDVKKDFLNIPLLHKDEIIEDSLKLMAPQYVPLLYRNELLRKDTSGSTGKILEVYWRKYDYIRSMFSLWFYRKKFYNVKTWDKVCQFYTISEIGVEKENTKVHKNMLEFSKSNLSEERLLEIYKEMQNFEPVWLILQPCIAELLCKIKTKYKLPEIASLKYIEMTGEELTPVLKKKIQECFTCAVANQYGMAEVNSIAFECPEGNLHCLESNVYVEILDKFGTPVRDGEIGNIYVTTLHNYAMPFIRYETGDIGSIRNSTCSCGHKGKILDLKSSRKDEWIIMENKEKVNPYVFVRAVIAVNEIYDKCIFQFQIIQTNYNKFRVNLALEEKPENIEKCFISNIGHITLRDADYDFHYYDALFPELTGKRKFFKSEMAK